MALNSSFSAKSLTFSSLMGIFSFNSAVNSSILALASSISLSSLARTSSHSTWSASMNLSSSFCSS
jgi:hypothetical protein